MITMPIVATLLITGNSRNLRPASSGEEKAFVTGLDTGRSETRLPSARVFQDLIELKLGHGNGQQD